MSMSAVPFLYIPIECILIVSDMHGGDVYIIDLYNTGKRNIQHFKMNHLVCAFIELGDNHAF
jgi:hypothetical protein